MWPKDNTCHQFFLTLFPWINWILSKCGLYLGPACITINLNFVSSSSPSCTKPPGNSTTSFSHRKYKTKHTQKWDLNKTAFLMLREHGTFLFKWGQKKNMWSSLKMFTNVSSHTLDLAHLTSGLPLSVSHQFIIWGIFFLLFSISPSILILSPWNKCIFKCLSYQTPNNTWKNDIPLIGCNIVGIKILYLKALIIYLEW